MISQQVRKLSNVLVHHEDETHGLWPTGIDENIQSLEKRAGRPRVSEHIFVVS
jgi:hypothetical protein